MSSPIQIKSLGNKYFIFNAKDVERLRNEHRIVGYLTGTLARFPMQNGYYGLPLVLLPEQVDLLLKEELAVVVGGSMIKSKAIKTKLFEYFWSLEYFVTGGSKFGGDYLLYPGDPTSFHSQFIVSAMSTMDESFSCVDIVSKGRLATNVKKTFVLAGIDDNEEKEDIKNEVITFSIEWAGF